jgi:hypothetical protein
MKDEKLGRAKAATEAVARERSQSQRSAVKAIAKMQARLREAMGDEMMRLPNLSNASWPYRGVRVFAKLVNEKLPMPPRVGNEDGREVVCIDPRGSLVYARRLSNLMPTHRAVPPQDIRAEWPEDVAEAIVAAIDCHLQGCDRALERYSKITQLNQRLMAALEDPGE